MASFAMTMALSRSYGAVQDVMPQAASTRHLRYREAYLQVLLHLWRTHLFDFLGHSISISSFTSCPPWDHLSLRFTC